MKRTETILGVIGVGWIVALLVTSFCAFVFPDAAFQPYAERSAIFFLASGLLLLMLIGGIHEENEKNKKAAEPDKTVSDANANSTDERDS